MYSYVVLVFRMLDCESVVKEECLYVTIHAKHNGLKQIIRQVDIYDAHDRHYNAIANLAFFETQSFHNTHQILV